MKSLKDLDDKTVKELATDMFRQKIWPSWAVPQDLWYSVFMPIVFMDPKELPDNLYGILGHEKDIMGNTCVNGFPAFGTITMVNKASADKICELARKMEALVSIIEVKPEADKNQEKLEL